MDKHIEIQVADRYKAYDQMEEAEKRRVATLKEQIDDVSGDILDGMLYTMAEALGVTEAELLTTFNFKLTVEEK